MNVHLTLTEKALILMSLNKELSYQKELLIKLPDNTYIPKMIIRLNDTIENIQNSIVTNF